MQPIGDKGRHNYHGLESNEIVDALSLVSEPILIYETYSNRYGIVVNGEPKYKHIMIVVELNASLSNNRDANVNKIVTIYPKDNLEKSIKNIDKRKILYQK